MSVFIYASQAAPVMGRVAHDSEALRASRALR